MDLSCPIELRGCTLTSESGVICAQVHLFNASARRLCAFEAVAKWHSASSGRSVAAPFTSEGLRAAPSKEFTIALHSDKLPDADRLDLLFTSVSYEDGGADWRLGEGDIVDAAPIVSVSAENLAMLRSVAGEDAVCFPLQEDKTWRCVCGKINLNSTEHCGRCHRDHFTVIGYTAENVRFHFRTDAPIPPEMPPEDLEPLHVRYLRQRSRLLRRTLIVGAALVILTALMLIHQNQAGAVGAAVQAAQMFH